MSVVGSAFTAKQHRRLGGILRCLRHYFPSILTFLVGFFSAGLIMISFDSVTPCGKTLTDTILSSVANVTKTSWDTSHSKYKIQCPQFPPDFDGKLTFPLPSTPTYDKLNEIFGSTFTSDPLIGGHFKPEWCQAKDKVAIIIPYRNRDDNLRQFLFYMHQLMQKQLHDYAIFVIEQGGSDKVRFNRGILLNVGFIEAMKAYDFQCVIFYDVDKVPEDDRNFHGCPHNKAVRHMAAYQHRFQNQPFRDEYFGGVLAMNSVDVETINGFSNIFFGYGFEDDEFLKRIKIGNLTIYREHPVHTKYWNLEHAGEGLLGTGFDWKWENEKLLPMTADRMPIDGLNSVTYLDINIQKLVLFTKITIGISEKQILKQLMDKNPALFERVATAINLKISDLD